MIEITIDKKDYNSSNDYIIYGNNVVKLDHNTKKSVGQEEAKDMSITYFGLISLISIPVLIGTLMEESTGSLMEESTGSFLGVLLFIGSIFFLFSLIIIMTMVYDSNLKFNGKVAEEIKVEEYKIVKKYTPENLALLHSALDEKAIYPKETHNTINNAIDAIIQNAQIEKEKTIRLENEKEQIAKEILKKNTTDADMTIIDSWDKVSREIVQSNNNFVNNV